MTIALEHSKGVVADPKDVSRIMSTVHSPEVSPIDKYLYLRDEQA